MENKTIYVEITFRYGDTEKLSIKSLAEIEEKYDLDDIYQIQIF